MFWLAAHAPRIAALSMRQAYTSDPDRPAVRCALAKLPAPAGASCGSRSCSNRSSARRVARSFASASLRLNMSWRWTRALGFSLREIGAPVHLMIPADADANVPPCVAWYLVAEIPGATLTIISGAAHRFIIDALERLLARI